ncbi:MAG: hypothetical protein A2511_00775 [Deltaproteobacteria bacterium RIFOXYD12_FULL_50_9]|nr:MAG: hypothetical protein A2511_00775 [Deltaproteobacteria bacterium RIFOXYD12_FULL_50_9]
MGDSPGEAFCNQQLAFIGRVSAGFTHEFMNHLAVINESAGLLGDLFALAKRKGIAVDHDRCLKIIASIGDRVALAAELAGYVNRFSHRLDESAVNFSVSDVLAELVALLERFARQRNVKFVANLSPTVELIHNNPALLQFVVYSLFMTTLAGLSDGGMLTVVVQKIDNKVWITLRAKGWRPEQAGAETDPGDEPVLSEALHKLAAEFDYSSHAEGCLDVVLRVAAL